MQDLLIDILSHYGMKEVDGSGSNKEILDMIQKLMPTAKDDSEVAWCSAMINYFARKNGYEATDSLAARSWLKMPIMVLKPTIGDVVVISRGDSNSWQGHVGLFIGWGEKYIYILGGNQNNQINISAYDRNRVLGFRQLRKVK